MACHHSSIGGVSVIVHGPDKWLSLEPFGAKVWMEWHNYLGPSFFRGESANVEIRNPSKKTWDAFQRWYDSVGRP